MKSGIVKLAALIVLSLVAACSLPRGAPTKPEVLSSTTLNDETIAVVPVTRDNVRKIAAWPVTGWHGHYHWLESTRGPDSNLIRTGDVIDLTIWDNQENSLLTNNSGRQNAEILSLRVSPSGTILIPYIDQVALRGLTPDQARDLVQTRCRTGPFNVGTPEA